MKKKNKYKSVAFKSETGANQISANYAGYAKKRHFFGIYAIVIIMAMAMITLTQFFKNIPTISTPTPTIKNAKSIVYF